MQDVKLLFVDDEQDVLSNITDYLSGYNVTTFSDPEKAMEEIKNTHFDIIVSDFKMPKVSGLDLLIEARKHNAYKYGILFTAFADKSLLEEMLNKNLVNQIIEKPFMLKDLKSVLDEAIQVCRESNEKENKIELIKEGYENLKKEFNIISSSIVGIDKGLKGVYKKVVSVAKHSVNVLITGETGTGKELIAKAIHNLSPRRDGPFIKINSTAIPETLFESELFGYKKGAFTNAVSDKPGKIELANNGTLFLDEIGDMDIGLQAKLLRVLQEKVVERLGSNKQVEVNFRLIAATNKNIEQIISENRFREDLFYRINEFPIHLPSLRKRREDIPDLINFFAKNSCEELNIRNIKISDQAIKRLQDYTWNGNIRELENAVKRVVIAHSDEEVIDAEHFNFLFNGQSISCGNLNTDDAIELLKNEIISNKLNLKDMEEKVLLSILEHYNDNVAEAVDCTGISKNKFYKVK
jgi:DNA-binding NtrC family response regulator